MGRVVCARRAHTTQRVSAIEILTTDLGLLYVSVGWVELGTILGSLSQPPRAKPNSQFCQVPCWVSFLYPTYIDQNWVGAGKPAQCRFFCRSTRPSPSPGPGSWLGSWPAGSRFDKPAAESPGGGPVADRCSPPPPHPRPGEWDPRHPITLPHW